MRLLIVALSFSLMLFTTVACAGPYEQGVLAFRAGRYAAALKLWKPLAQAGNGRAQYDVGEMYLFGVGVSRDPAEAVKWFRRAAQNHDQFAGTALGSMYELGFGVERSPQTAIEWFHRGAVAGDALAQYALGGIYREGLGVPKNASLAAKWIRKAAKQGYVIAQANLGLMYKVGDEVAKNGPMAARWFHRAAAQVKKPKYFDRGVFRLLGAIAPGKLKKLRSAHHRDILRDIAASEAMLGSMYEHGIGVPKSRQLSVSWYRKAATLGLVPAQIWVAYAYQQGNGVRRDFHTALKWYRKAAENKTPPKDYLAVLSSEYDVTPPKAWRTNLSDARARRAKVRAIAQEQLGYMYEHGEGVSPDYEKAFMWYRKAAAAGSSVAQTHLGYMYQHGEGVHTNLQTARMWYRKAAAQSGSCPKAGEHKSLAGGSGTQ